MSARKKAAAKTRPLRFRPDPLDVAYLALAETPGEFVAEAVALISDESPLHGCGLVLTDHPGLQVEVVLTVKVGRMDPVKAKVVWKKTLLPHVVHLGIQYLE